ncbi:MAG: ABC transporter permease subunit [Chloroflexia bacterium]|jgi:NitT/TauT family transport system permease protein|nr:ABC transporter permease subunit [Chloroflexia bacterium]
MSRSDSDIASTIPTFDHANEQHHEVGLSGMTALSSSGAIKSGRDALIIVLIAVGLVAGLELWIELSGTRSYVLPKPTAIATALYQNFGLFWPHVFSTVRVLAVGYSIGAVIGLFLAATITQMPFVEKVITPYILLLVTTPMIALVPLLSTQLGYDSLAPRIIVVALASGPLVMINSATGFRRTDLGKIALAKSYGASTLQIFTKIRFPLALPMIIVGLMVGAIFGLLTAVGAEMVGSSEGLGNRLVFYSSRVQMDNFFAIIVILAVIGITDYILFFLIGKKWASWES